MNEAMQKLIDAVQKASPIVWQAAYRQVLVDVAELSLWVIAAIMAARYLLLLRRKLMLKDENGYRGSDGDDPGPVFCVIGMVICSIVALICATGIMDSALNPTFAAIKNLKGLL